METSSFQALVVPKNGSTNHLPQLMVIVYSLFGGLASTYRYSWKKGGEAIKKRPFVHQKKGPETLCKARQMR